MPIPNQLFPWILTMSVNPMTLAPPRRPGQFRHAIQQRPRWIWRVAPSKPWVIGTGSTKYRISYTKGLHHPKGQGTWRNWERKCSKLRRASPEDWVYVMYARVMWRGSWVNPTLEDPGFTMIAWGLRLGFPITQLVELPAERTPGMLNSLKQYEIAFFGTAAARLEMLVVRSPQRLMIWPCDEVYRFRTHVPRGF